VPGKAGRLGTKTKRSQDVYEDEQRSEKILELNFFQLDRLQYAYVSMISYERLLLMALAGCVLCACSTNDNSHTTVTTVITPPPHQVLSVVDKPSFKQAIPTPSIDATADAKKPLLLLRLRDEQAFQTGDEVPIDFSVVNAKLKGDGGEYRVRYIIDDDEMKWLEKAEPFSLVGWTPGKHTVRVELIGPDGWPYKNGNANILTREIVVGD